MARCEMFVSLEPRDLRDPRDPRDPKVRMTGPKAPIFHQEIMILKETLGVMWASDVDLLVSSSDEP